MRAAGAGQHHGVRFDFRRIGDCAAMGRRSPAKGLRIPGTTTGNVAVNSMSAYIDLPNGIILITHQHHHRDLATPLAAPNWARLCDFGRTAEAGNGLAGEWTGGARFGALGATTASDDLMLSAAVGTTSTSKRFEAKLNGSTTVTLDAGPATTAGATSLRADVHRRRGARRAAGRTLAMVSRWRRDRIS